MQLKACWRYKQFTKTQPSPPINSSQPVGQFPETKSQTLTVQALKNKSRRTLWLMRNEMFARYGYIFKEPDLATYFNKQSWYQESQSDHLAIYYDDFSERERQNVKFIRQEENKLLWVPSPSPNLATPCDFPKKFLDRYLSESDVAGKSRSELRLMRNAIFAYHGLQFEDVDLQNRLQQCNWYQPRDVTAASLYSDELSESERYNVEFIRRYE
jgi:hypothetical protein